MLVGLTEDQTILRDSVGRYLEDSYPFAERQRAIDTPDGFLPEHWNGLVELGLTAAPFPETSGGLGLSTADLCVILREMGAHNFVSPYLASLILAGGVLAQSQSPTALELVTRLTEGITHAAFAHAEAGGRYNLAWCETRAERNEDGYRIDGRKTAVLWAPLAEFLIVVARTDGEPGDEDGLGLFLVEASADGVEVRGYPTNDGHRAGEVRLEGVQIPAENRLDDGNATLAIIEDTTDRAALMLAAEASGACATLLAQALEYVGQREQFGRPIGKFQVVQHSCADMSIQCDTLDAATFAAAFHMDQGADRLTRQRLISTAKAQAGWSGKFIGETAFGLHGGVAMSTDLPIGHFLKRLWAIHSTLGDPDYHVRRVQALDRTE